MIYLTKGQPLADNAGLVVCDPTGYYNDGDSIACAPFHMPEEPVYRYEAKFVAYGGMVYEITDEDKLLEEVKKMNPETLFGKNKEEVAVDKIIDDIVTQEAGENAKQPITEGVAAPIAATTETVKQASATKQISKDPIITSTIPAIETITTTTDSGQIVVPPAIEPIVTPEIINAEPITSTPENIIQTVTKISDTVDKIIDVGNNINNLAQ